jgi:hypothetical protein
MLGQRQPRRWPSEPAAARRPKPKKPGQAPFTNRDAKPVGEVELAKEHLTRLRDKKEQWERYCQENDISDLRFYYQILPKVAAGEEDDPLHWLKRRVQLADLDDLYDYIGFLHLVCRRPMAISILAA